MNTETEQFFADVFAPLTPLEITIREIVSVCTRIECDLRDRMIASVAEAHRRDKSPAGSPTRKRLNQIWSDGAAL